MLGGDISSGQTNLPPNLAGVSAIASGWGHSLALLSNGTVVAWGDNTYGQTNVPPDLTNAIAVAAGNMHSLALTRGGSIITWGDDGSGLFAVPAGLEGAAFINAGGYFSLAIKVEFKIRSIERAGQAMRLRFDTVAGQPCAIEYSPALAPSAWSRLPGGEGNGAGGETVVEDPAAADAPSRFYRLIRLP